MNFKPRASRTVTMGVDLAFALAIAAGALVLTAPPAVAAACNGASHQKPTLSGGGATPTSGSPSTIFVFSVRYADAQGCVPSRVVLVIPGQPTAMMTTSGTNFQAGVVFTVSRQLPAGVWTYYFEAVSGSGPGQRTTTFTSVTPASIMVTAPTPAPTPTPTPTPTPKPTPTPTPTPTATPAPTPPPKPKATPPPPTPRPTSTPASATTTPKPTRTSAPPGPSGSGAGGSGSASPGAGSGSTGFGSTGSGGPPVTAAAIQDGRDEGTASWAIPPEEIVQIGGGFTGIAAIGAWLSTTVLGLVVFAWTLRRPEREEDSPLAAALSMVAAARGGFNRDIAAPLQAAVQPALAETGGVDPANLAWMPSSSGALRLTGNRPSGWQSRPALRFGSEPARDAIRRQITYRLVRLSDAPDDLRSSEIERLDRGDEVEILGREGSFLQVRTPTGAVGWVPSDSTIG